MNIIAVVYPNASDLWTAFALPVTDLPVGFSIRSVMGRLMDISPIESSIELVESLSLDSKESVIQGVGGISTETDVSITINNLKGSLNAYSLFGRSIRIFLFKNDYLLTNINTRFFGYINSVDPSNNGDILILKCKSTLGRLLGKDVGIVTGYDGESIAPICYGTFNTTTTLVPVTQTTNLSVNDISVGQNNVGSVDNVYVWDEGLQSYHSLKTPINLTNTNSMSLGNLSSIPLYLETSINNTTEDIYIYCPPMRAFSSTDSLAGMVVGDIYRYSTPNGTILGALMEIREGNYLLFTTYDHEDFVPSYSGTLVRHSGSGPISITYNYRSDIIYRSISPDAESGSWVSGSTPNNSYTRAVSAKPKSINIKIDNEIIHLFLMVEEETATDNNGYIYYVRTLYKVKRGVSETISASHSTNAVIYNFFSEDNSREEIMKDPLSYNQSLLFRANVPLYEFSGMYFASKIYDNGGTEYPRVKRTLVSNSLNPLGPGSLIIEWRPDSVNSISAGSSNLILDLSFKNSSLSGVISNTYLLGTFGLSHSGESGTTPVWLATLEISKGGLSYNKGAGSWYTECAELNYPFYTPNLIEPGLSIYNNIALSRSPYISNDTTILHDHSYDSSMNELYGLNPFMGVFVPAEFPYMFGSMDNLSNMGSTRYFLMLKTSLSNSYTYTTTDYHRTTLNINNLALAVDFFLDITNAKLLRGGTGIIAPHLNAPALHANDILIDVFQSILGSGSSVDNTDSSTLSNLIISGKPRSIREEVEKFAKNTGICISQDYIGRVVFSDIYPSDSVSVAILNDSTIIKYTQEYTDTKSVVTDLFIKYNKDFSSEKFKNQITVSDSSSLQYTNNEVQRVSVEAGAIINSVSAYSSKIAYYLCKPRRKLTVEVIQPDVPYVIGDYVKIDSSTIRDTFNFIYKIIGVSDNLLKGTFTLTLVELPNNTGVLLTYGNNNFQATQNNLEG